MLGPWRRRAAQGDIIRLSSLHEAAIEEILEEDPITNLFLLGFLSVHPVDRSHWYGRLDGERVRGVALILPERLCVPYLPDLADALAVGRHLARRHDPCLTVGPRDQTDALWEGWGSKPAVLCYDQRLYVMRSPPAVERAPGFRRANFHDWPVVAALSSQMELEDLGRDPAAEDPALHAQVVQERVKAGRTYVIEQDGEIVFQVHIGTVTPWGTQIGGTYVPVAHRGKGWATRGIASLCAELLRRPHPRCPAVTLHVNEQNTAAVRVYERVGFTRDRAFRLITV